jgi:hypothetical protein
MNTHRTLNPTQRRLAALAVAAWLVLGTAYATGWPHTTPAAAVTTPDPEAPGHTRRICYRDGTAALITPMPGGRELAIGDGTCTYTGPTTSADPADHADDMEGNR